MGEIVNWLAWGNGEPCPFCGKPFEKVDIQHLFDEHADALTKQIFTPRREAKP